jgi:DNA-binding transcriptional LysR family regulator
VDTLTSIEVFRNVVEQKSFAAAARRLNLSPAMVTKHVMHLEKRLNTRLLNRTSRHLSLTESGALYFEQTKTTLDELLVLEQAVNRSTVAASGVLKLTAPAWMANPKFLRILARYQAQHPAVVLDIDLSGRQLNLVDEGIDLALRAGRKIGDNLIARPLCKVPFMWVGSPSYIKKHGSPRNLASLTDHAVLGYALLDYNEAMQLHGKRGPEAVRLSPQLLCNSESLLHVAALEGMGLAGLPTWMIETDLKEKKLVRVLVQYQPFVAEIYAVYASRKFLSSKVRTFIDFMGEHLPTVATR